LAGSGFAGSILASSLFCAERGGSGGNDSSGRDSTRPRMRAEPTCAGARSGSAAVVAAAAAARVVAAATPASGGFTRSCWPTRSRVGSSSWFHCASSRGSAPWSSAML
jgi:hypothetical protein